MVPKQILYKRAAFIQAVRLFFVNRGYLEVDTPVRLPSIAPEAYIEPEMSGDMFLQTSPELCMKRLLAQGIPKLFQICRCFRKGERGRLHAPEFTMLEWYRSEADYSDLMNECELLLGEVASALGKDKITYAGRTITLEPPWQRITVADAFQKFAPVSAFEALKNDTFDEVLVECIEPNLGIERPTFIYDYPAELAALSQLKDDDQTVAERFELYVGGVELANGFSELTDATVQRQRFVKEREKIVLQGRDPGPMPEKFLAALIEMPAAAGIAFGLDRLLMLLLNYSSIDDVLPFSPEDLKL